MDSIVDHEPPKPHPGYRYASLRGGPLDGRLVQRQSYGTWARARDGNGRVLRGRAGISTLIRGGHVYLWDAQPPGAYVWS